VSIYSKRRKNQCSN